MRLSRDIRALPTPAGLALDLTLVLALGDRLAFLELPPPAPEPELHLRDPVREVHAGSTSASPRSAVFPIRRSISLRCRRSFGISSGPGDPCPSRTRRAGCACPRATPRPRTRPKGLRQRAAAAAGRLPRPPRGDPRLEPLEDLVVVARPAVGNDGLLAGGVALRAHGRGAGRRGTGASRPGTRAATRPRPRAGATG